MPKTWSVYYATADGICKIGYSSNPKERVRQLGGTLLAVEVVGHDRREASQLERARHRQFHRLRLHPEIAPAYEWFRFDDALVDHIVALQAAA
jgi:hypothetical protein